MILKVKIWLIKRLVIAYVKVLLLFKNACNRAGFKKGCAITLMLPRFLPTILVRGSWIGCTGCEQYEI